MIIGFSFTCDNFLTKVLLVDPLFPKSRTALNCTCHIKRAMYNMTATGLWTVSAFDAHRTLRLYTSLKAKGKAKKSINLLKSSIHRKKPGVYDVLACTWIRRWQEFIAQTGLVSLRRKYKDMRSHLLGSQRIFFRSIFFSTVVMTCTKYREYIS